MGRKSKYKTEKERKLANKERYMKYYWKHRDVRKQKALERYYEKKKRNSVV